MIAVLGGLGASICFTVSALCASAASRRIGAPSTLAWVMVIGLVFVVPPTLIVAKYGQLTGHRLLLLAILGSTNVLGLAIEYVAFRRGKVGVVTPIASAEGMVAAVIAIFAGLHLAVKTALLLLVIVFGVVLAAAHPDPPSPDGGEDAKLRSAVLAVPVAVLFGISLYTTGRVGLGISVWWVVVPARLFGSVLLAAPLAVRRQLQPPGRSWPLVAAAGAAEVLGILSYTLGARHELAIAAVLASQFAALSALGAYFLFGERLTRLQLAGLVVVVAGVSVLSAVGT